MLDKIFAETRINTIKNKLNTVNLKLAVSIKENSKKSLKFNLPNFIAGKFTSVFPSEEDIRTESQKIPVDRNRFQLFGRFVDPDGEIAIADIFAVVHVEDGGSPTDLAPRFAGMGVMQVEVEAVVGGQSVLVDQGVVQFVKGFFGSAVGVSGDAGGDGVRFATGQGPLYSDFPVVPVEGIDRVAFVSSAAGGLDLFVAGSTF